MTLHQDSFGAGQRFRVLGVSISAVNLQDTICTLDRWIRENYRTYIVLTGAHGVVEMQRDHELRSINNSSGLTTPDGMPIVWLARLRGFRNVEKVYAPDIMRQTFRVLPPD